MKLISDIFTDKVKGFLAGVGASLLFYFVNEVLARISMLEHMMDLVVAALSGQRS